MWMELSDSYLIIFISFFPPLITIYYFKEILFFGKKNLNPKKIRLIKFLSDSFPIQYYQNFNSILYSNNNNNNKFINLNRIESFTF